MPPHHRATIKSRRFIRRIDIEPPAGQACRYAIVACPIRSRMGAWNTDVRNGSKADLGKADMRQRRRYSITWSASNCIEDGTLRQHAANAQLAGIDRGSALPLLAAHR